VNRLQCRNCGSPLDPRRVELGYDYCLKAECQQLYVKRVKLAALGVNKAADYYVRADEVLPPPAPAPLPAGHDEDEDGSGEPGPAGGSPSAGSPSPPSTDSEPRPRSTLARLRDRETQLDRDLARSYNRFVRGDITAREMDAEQRRRVADFNRAVMNENIRYRSFLRRQPPG
jgi:hypothetical protein